MAYAMKTRKVYIIIELHTGTILDSTTDQWASMKLFDEFRKAGREVTAQCIYQ